MLFLKPMAYFHDRRHGMKLLHTVISLCVILVGVNAAKLHSERLAVRALKEPGEWAARAHYNLSIWRSTLFSRTEAFIAAHNNSDTPTGKWERFQIAQPFISCPPGRPLRRFGGTVDGGKWLCDVTPLQQPCAIISAGSNMDFTFEESMLSETPCQVATVDCTVDGAILSSRHTFYQLCVGSAEDARAFPRHMTNYDGLVRRLRNTPVAVLKIDVESCEFPFFAEWNEFSPHLPEQIAVEVHLNYHETKLQFGPDAVWQSGFQRRGDFGALDVALFFGHLANLGYGVVASEVNPDWGTLSEFTLFRVETSTHYLEAAAYSAGMRGDRPAPYP